MVFDFSPRVRTVSQNGLFGFLAHSLITFRAKLPMASKQQPKRRASVRKRGPAQSKLGRVGGQSKFEKTDTGWHRFTGILSPSYPKSRLRWTFWLASSGRPSAKNRHRPSIGSVSGLDHTRSWISSGGPKNDGLAD